MTAKTVAEGTVCAMHYMLLSICSVSSNWFHVRIFLTFFLCTISIIAVNTIKRCDVTITNS